MLSSYNMYFPNWKDQPCVPGKINPSHRPHPPPEKRGKKSNAKTKRKKCVRLSQTKDENKQIKDVKLNILQTNENKTQLKLVIQW